LDIHPPPHFSPPQTILLVVDHSTNMVGGAVMFRLCRRPAFLSGRDYGRALPGISSRAAAVVLFIGFNDLLPASHLAISACRGAITRSAGISGAQRVVHCGRPSILALGYCCRCCYLTWSMRYGKVAAESLAARGGVEKRIRRRPRRKFPRHAEGTWSRTTTRTAGYLTCGGRKDARAAHGDD